MQDLLQRLFEIREELNRLYCKTPFTPGKTQEERERDDRAFVWGRLAGIQDCINVVELAQEDTSLHVIQTVEQSERKTIESNT
jgi:hypothetical protein